VYQTLPFQRFSPFLYAGGGISRASNIGAADLNKQTAYHLKGGVGLEVSLGKFVGLRGMADYCWFTNDGIDGLRYGIYNDSFLRFSLGTAFYIGKASRKKSVPVEQK